MTDDEAPVKPFGLTLTTPLRAEDRDKVWALVWELAEAKEEVERLRATVHAQRHEIRRLRALCGDDRAPDAHRGGAHSEPTTTDDLRAEAERLAEGAGLRLATAWEYANGGRMLRCECWLPKRGMNVVIVEDADEPTALRALVAALREIRRGDG